mgnify:CR=1 FL=1
MQNYSIDVSQIFIEEDKVERSHCSSWARNKKKTKPFD